MLEQLNLNSVMVLDIETVPVAGSYEDLPENLKKVWAQRAERLNQSKSEPVSVESMYFDRAGIFAEFGKIICISAGIFKEESEGLTFRIKSFAGHDEKKLLTDFKNTLDEHFSVSKNYLCAHNGKEFDYPYMARRMLINRVPLPAMLDISGKKPWETAHLLDTMEMWKFGDFKNYTSLELLAALFEIDTPKDDIKGSDVANVYWQENDLPRIVKYCQKDIITLARLLMRFKNLEPVTDEQIIFNEPEDENPEK